MDKEIDALMAAAKLAKDALEIAHWLASQDDLIEQYCEAIDALTKAGVK